MSLMKTNISGRATTALLLALLGGAVGGCKHYTISEQPEITAPSKYLQPPGQVVNPPSRMSTPPPGTVTAPGGKGWSTPK